MAAGGLETVVNRSVSYRHLSDFIVSGWGFLPNSIIPCSSLPRLLKEIMAVAVGRENSCPLRLTVPEARPRSFLRRKTSLCEGCTVSARLARPLVCPSAVT